MPRLSKVESHILHYIKHASHPVTQQEIREYLAKHAISAHRTSVYRIIHKLREHQEIIQTSYEGGKLAYVYRHNHNHVIQCMVCNRHTSLAPQQLRVLESTLEGIQNDMMRDCAFMHISHNIQFFGTCSHCVIQ